jgi:tetratricopeptide (TPR) repeat protein
VSANEANLATAVPERPPRRWYRGPWFYAAVVVCALLVGGGVYLGFGRRDPEPPGVNPTGIDPLIAAAIERERAAVREAPRSAAAWGRLGMILMVHDFRAQADVCLAQAECLDPTEPRWPYYQALGALLAGDAKTAYPKLERAIALCGNVFDAPRVRLAELLVSENRLDEAEEQFRRLLQTDPRHPRAQLGLARVAYQRGDLRGSLGYLSAAQRSEWTQKAALLLQAEIHQRLGNPAAAAEAQRKAATLPDDPFWPDPLNEEITALRTGKHAWRGRADRLALDGRNADAVALLQQTRRVYPDADDVWLQLGQLYLKMRDGRAAEQALRRATELAPRQHLNVYYLGVAQIVLGNLQGAAACFRKAVELKPDYAPAHHNLGKCLSETGDVAGAREAYRTALRCEPNLFESQLGLATLQANTGQLAEALEHARHAVRLRPADPAAQRLLRRVAYTLATPLAVP